MRLWRRMGRKKRGRWSKSGISGTKFECQLQIGKLSLQLTRGLWIADFASVIMLL